MTPDAKRQVWSQFWSGGGAGPESGCLPRALLGIDAAQKAAWQEFGRQLTRGARVLDLATGDGAVLGKLRSTRSDLKLTGTDYATELPVPRTGIKLRAGVAMEALPFAPCSFDAITSQFGFEYSDRDRSAGEAARVLVSGGVLQFLIHHRDGPILAHNRPRAAALRWAAFDNGLLDKAVALVRARASASIPTPALFRDAPVRARHLFQAQSVAEEFTTAILQILELSRFEAHSKGLEALAALRMRAEGELGRIEALTAAACGRDEIEAIRRRLLVEGVVTVEPEPICEAGSARPFAWKLAGSKQA